ncbi:hypothetical protein K469DRAFT_712275, partial [Zopfia rhizophila CBS 207.26]
DNGGSYLAASLSFRRVPLLQRSIERKLVRSLYRRVALSTCMMQGFEWPNVRRKMRGRRVGLLPRASQPPKN